MRKDDTADFAAFWGEMSPCEHLLQIYKDDVEFLDVLERFISDGFKKGESVVVIATSSHLIALEKRLARFDLDKLRAADQYLPFDAEHTLSTFMVDNWPDDELFEKSVMAILERARKGRCHVRAFGEMVALLWAQGHSGATIRLEFLWNNLLKTQVFQLFCAYPKGGFTEDATESIKRICSEHSRILPATIPAMIQT